MQPLQEGTGPVQPPLALAPQPAVERQVRSADGTVLHVEISGPQDAPTIVLAHGITCTLEAWHYQIAGLSRAYRVVAYDQRGHGRSARPGSEGYTVAALGEDLQAVLDTCAPDQQVVLAGHSMGGMSIMTWAQQFPDQVAERVGAAALVCTAGSGVLSDTAAMATVAAPMIARRIAFAPMRTPIVPGVRSALRWLTFGVKADPVDVAALSAMINACPGRTRSRFARSLSAMNLIDGLDTLNVPTVVIGGQRDRLLPIKHSKDIAERLPRLLDFQPLPGIGHMAPFESHEYLSWRLADLADQHLPHA